MNFLKSTFSLSQIKALLRKDILVRWRQPWMTVVQVIWPICMFLLLYLIRLKFTPIEVKDCQFPTRQLPTKGHSLASFHSYICSTENRCIDPKDYEEYSDLENAPLKPIVDTIQIFINDDSLFNTVIELPEKANFVGAITTLFFSGQMDKLRANVQKAIDMVPKVEKYLNGSFDINKLFSDRKTFVKGGYILCGYPFPDSHVIPLINDVLYSEDFSEINDDELKVMPTKYCKKLYLDVTSSNYGKLSWNTLKPILHGKIVYSPDNEDTRTIIQNSNSTFEELHRLQMLSVAVQEMFTKLRTDETFQKSFEELIDLAKSPFVRGFIGDQIDIDQIEAILTRLRVDPIIYSVTKTVKELLECISVDRFVPVSSLSELRTTAFNLNKVRLFYAGVSFENIKDANVSYKFHVDTDSTMPTMENQMRFWYPDPASKMSNDLKYHKGFVQIKNAIDIGIIKFKKIRSIGNSSVREEHLATTESGFKVEVFDNDNDKNDDEDDDWFTNVDFNHTEADNGQKVSLPGNLLSTLFGGNSTSNTTVKPVVKNDNHTTPGNSTIDESRIFTPVPSVEKNVDQTKLDDFLIGNGDVNQEAQSLRQKRQSLDDFLFNSDMSKPLNLKYQIDDMSFFTKQFPFPAYKRDEFKIGVYLGQGVQVAFFLGLIAHIATSVRHLIWMRESRNTMIMRCMGLKPSSELSSWIIVSLSELMIIFAVCNSILFFNGTVEYTSWPFVYIFLIIFAGSLVSFNYMISTFFNSATNGAVAAVIFFFISFCPYILVMLFAAHMDSVKHFFFNLSLTTAFSQAWSEIMRSELQQVGLTFETVMREGISGEFGYGVMMIVIDMFIHITIAYINQRFRRNELRFEDVRRENLDSSVGATMTNVTKIYNSSKVAVSQISLSFNRNEVTCLLGRNGAGKSTIIKMMTGQEVPTSGRVVLSESISITNDHDKVGVCSQDNILIPNLTAREHLEIYAKIKMKYNYISEVKRTLKSLNFGKYESYQACQLSGGYQRKLCVAMAFIGSPNVVILDEPCNGIDLKARKQIWGLIERLRKGRAVIFATHFLDEAENLSDAVVVMNNGKIIARYNQKNLVSHCTTNYIANIQCSDNQSVALVMEKSKEFLNKFHLIENMNPLSLCMEIAYDQQNQSSANFLSYLEEMENVGRVTDFNIENQNLDKVFADLNMNANCSNGYSAKIIFPNEMEKGNSENLVDKNKLCCFVASFHLFRKRLIHFSRNYKILICVILLPVVFQLIALWFMSYRAEDDYSKTIKLSRSDLYPQTTQMLSLQNSNDFTAQVYDSLRQQCSASDINCVEFDRSDRAFYWILTTLHEYRAKRFGGYSFNATSNVVWYNNRGYHAMISWLNDLNTILLQRELNDSSYSITAYNEPWKLGLREFSSQSILRQAGDTCMVFIFVVSFSLVTAGASVYLVNERVNGEKLQQKLCGVNTFTYWAVSFVWDSLLVILGVLICVCIVSAFGTPVFVSRQQLWGLIVLSVLFGYASICVIHVFEKCFNDASVAIVTIFCMNVIIPLFTVGTVVLLGVIGSSETWDQWRYFINRAFLIFPQHAFGDGLIELCKNLLVSEMFHRYDINTYKHPVFSNLLEPHYLSLISVGTFFALVNVGLETGWIHRFWIFICDLAFCRRSKAKKHLQELKIVSIQQSLKRTDSKDSTAALQVENISKCYRRDQFVVKNATFHVNAGQCFGLLGKNGAGKSTIFKILSGELKPDLGTIHFIDPEISYCPQTNTVDALLTVRECIQFYGTLRRIKNIPKLITNVLEYFQLAAHADVLVKNLSGGNRRKLTVATTCFGRSPIVLMDEPTSDMDPITRAFVYSTINDLLANDRAILLTSHSISEIDNICHYIAILKDGQILTCSTPENLKSQYGGFYNVTVYGDAHRIEEIERILSERFPQCLDIEIYANSIKFVLKTGSNQNQTKKQMSENSISNVTPTFGSTATLSEIFNTLYDISIGNFNGNLRYSVSRCLLDSVFERVLDSSEENEYLGGVTRSDALTGSLSTGFIHNGFIETETMT